LLGEIDLLLLRLGLLLPLLDRRLEGLLEEDDRELERDEREGDLEEDREEREPERLREREEESDLGLDFAGLDLVSFLFSSGALLSAILRS